MIEIQAPPFFLLAGPTRVLLIHGFTASPTEMRPLGAFLHQRGLTVSGIRLAGHGTTPADLARTHWQDWYAAAQTGLEELSPDRTPVFVAGLSMGSLLAIQLAAEYPDQIAGLCLLCPPLRLRSPFLFLAPWIRPIRRAIPKSPRSQAYLRAHQLFSYPVMPTAALVELHHLVASSRRQLSQVTCPVQIAMGQQDQTVCPGSALDLFNRLPGPARNLILLPRADHILTVEPGCQYLFERIGAFIAARTRGTDKKKDTA